MGNNIAKLEKLLGVDIRYFARNSFWVTFKNGSGMLVGFFLSMAFARLVTPQVYGQYLFVLSTMFMANFLSVPKFDFAVSQSVAKGYDQSLFQAVKVSLVGSGIAGLVMLGVAQRYFMLGDPNLGKSFVLVGIFFPLLFGLRAYDHFLIGKKRFDLSAKFSALSSLLTGFGLILAMLTKQPVYIIILAYLLVNGGLPIVYFLRTRSMVANKYRDPGVVGFGVYLTSLAVTGMVVSKLGSVLLAHFQGPVDLAIYSVAMIIPSAIQNQLQNFVDVARVKVADRSRSELVKVLKRHALKWVGLGIITTAGLWLILPIAIPIIYSNKYNQAIILGQMASLALIFWPINTFLATLVMLEKKKKIIALSNFLPSVPNIILLPLAIAKFGMWGIVGVNLFSWAYMTPFNLWAFYRKKDL